MIVAARALPERAVLPVGRALGRLALPLASADRARAAANLELVFPSWSDARRRATVHRMFEHLGANAVEAVRLPVRTVVQRQARVTVQDLGILDAAFRRGHGVVAATGHLGNWEALAACFCDLGYPVNVVARRHPNPRLNELIGGIRRGYGATVLDRDKDIRSMLRALHRGDIVALLVDQHTRVQSAMLPFLGHPADTPLGHARLAARTGAALVVLTTARAPNGHHEVRVWAEVRPDESVPENARIETMARCCNQILSRAILETPEQWVWLHRRWRLAARPAAC